MQKFGGRSSYKGKPSIFNNYESQTTQTTHKKKIHSSTTVTRPSESDEEEIPILPNSGDIIPSPSAVQDPHEDDLQELSVSRKFLFTFCTISSRIQFTGLLIFTFSFSYSICILNYLLHDNDLELLNFIFTCIDFCTDITLLAMFSRTVSQLPNNQKGSTKKSALSHEPSLITPILVVSENGNEYQEVMDAHDEEEPNKKPKNNKKKQNKQSLPQDDGEGGYDSDEDLYENIQYRVPGRSIGGGVHKIGNEQNRKMKNFVGSDVERPPSPSSEVLGQSLSTNEQGSLPTASGPLFGSTDDLEPIKMATVTAEGLESRNFISNNFASGSGREH